MSWLAIALIVIGIWLAIKVVGAVLKLAFWGVALAGVYWLLAPYLGLPWPFG
jgi:hypothetical protein